MTTVYDTNAYLSQSEMTTNAQYILNFFLSKGWTKNAICGMLGNMQTESTINFGIYESLDNTSTTNGFGLVQWTPNTKYFDWASSNGYANDHVNGEMQRLLYEVANNVQWISTTTYNMSFSQFTTSTDTPENLASAWMYDYERPASYSTESTRQTQARNWFNTLSGSGGGSSPSPTADSQIITLFLTGAMRGWG